MEKRKINPKPNEPTQPNVTTKTKPWNSNNKRLSKKTPSNSNDREPKSFLTKYIASSSSAKENAFEAKIEEYRKLTPRKRLYDVIDLVPPPSTDQDMKARKAFWNNVRLKLRARLPQKLLFKMITPLDASEANKKKQSGKLHEVQATTKLTDILAMDCEMVGIGKSNTSILARVSIVNFDGDVVYDRFVQPINDPKCTKITDFREEVTGITRADLVQYGIEFETAQQEIIEILKGRQVVGHSLHNDLKVIKCSKTLQTNFYNTVHLKHGAKGEALSQRKRKQMLQKKRSEPWYFDTAQCELLNDDLNRPRSLKFLLELFLGIRIQSEAHDSVIDAISTMAIYRAILPEIRAIKQQKRLLTQKAEERKKEMKEKKESRQVKRSAVLERQRVLNNYAYKGELDDLIAQFDYDSKDSSAMTANDNFDKQLTLFNNPYRN